MLSTLEGAQGKRRLQAGTPVTMVGGREYVCEDLEQVEEMTRRSCRQLKILLPKRCEFVLKDANVDLPPELPQDATLREVCPDTCDACDENCNTGCPDWFLGNGHCDEACNTASCNFDRGDCREAQDTPLNPGDSVSPFIDYSLLFDEPSVFDAAAPVTTPTPPATTRSPPSPPPSTLPVSQPPSAASAGRSDGGSSSASCPPGQTFAAGECRNCSDQKDVETRAGISCEMLEQMVGCSFQLATSGMELPAGVPETATLATVCPGSCGLCTEICAADCPEWFRGNRHCDSACNVAACGFDGGDCADSRQPAVPMTTTTTTSTTTTALVARCEDNPVALSVGFACPILNGVAPLGCDTKLEDLSRDALPATIPPGTKVQDICFETCGLCQLPTCQDGFKNGDEEWIDCGGSCRPCQSCTASSLKRIDRNKFEVEGHENGLEHKAERTVKCADGFVPAEPSFPRLKKVEVETIHCLDGEFSEPKLLTCRETTTNVLEGKVFVRSSQIGNWDLAVVRPLMEGLREALIISEPNDLRIKEVTLSEYGPTPASSGSTGTSLRGLQAQQPVSGRAEARLSFTYWVRASSRTQSVEVTKATPAAFSSALRSALSSTDLSFPDLNDPSRKVSATEAFTSDDAITRDRIEFTSVRRKTVARQQWDDAFSGTDGGAWTAASRVSTIREAFGVPEIEEPKECRGRGPGRGDCCGMAAEVRSLLSGECGRWIYGGLMQPNYINAFCSRTDVAGSVGGRSCNAQLQAIISTYDGKPGAGCPMTARVRALSEGICQQRGGSYCLLDLQSNLGEFRQGIDGLVEKSAAELDGICAIDSCWRSNVRYVEAVAVLSNRRAGYTSPVDGYFLRGGHLKEWSEALIDAACVQEGGRYCQDTLRETAQSDPLNREGSGSFLSLCRDPCMPLKTAKLGSASIYWGELWNSPYHVVAGTLLKAHGRYGCVPERGGHFSRLPGRFCGDLLFEETEGSVEVDRPAVPNLPGCPDSCPRWYLADGECDPACFSEECNWDAGDCKASAMYPKFFSKVDSLVKRSCTPQWNAPERYECSTECFNQFNNALYNHGCCVAGALETMEELESSVRRLEGSSRNDDLIDWSIALVERTCKISMDRTCSDGDSRNLLKIVMGIDNLNADRLGDQQEAGVRAEVARAVADRLGVMPHDVARSSPVSVDGGTKVVVDVDTGRVDLQDSASEDTEVTARAVQRRLDNRPDLTAETFRIVPSEPVSVYTGEAVTPLEISSDTVNVEEPNLPAVQPGTFGAGSLESSEGEGITEIIVASRGEGKGEGLPLPEEPMEPKEQISLLWEAVRRLEDRVRVLEGR
uniref:LNR domain-containing protein n=1 Tax=Chromera velia CCMP2878 TaxID=1169474 RepID=A0A0G4HVS9_9ALVE|eukprot:Cvel_8867.t1-p1 / transcript=Cvel_8867.t1 / gene=Cvel_8867 / organism=Chromera_velia_CCMP2878 / gene_product=hypothetical protein / transcript_product=hypothetical protein / location=Cvel_scaffold498:73303-80370(-) / protein_length=1323 / sequence_SO=supercontig / SO=protein_coding / is_pseudo=false